MPSLNTFNFQSIGEGERTLKHAYSVWTEDDSLIDLVDCLLVLDPKEVRFNQF